MGRRLAAALAALMMGLSAAPSLAEDDTPWGILGASNAPVVLTEYVSPVSPNSARFWREMLPTIRTKYIDTGLVRLEVRERLVGPPAIAAAGFLLARCAGRDNYLAVLDRLYLAQPDMFADGTASNARRTLSRIAGDFGLSEDQFYACINDQTALEAVFHRDEQAARDGIKGVPLFLINGIAYDGPLDTEQLSAALDSALSKARRP